MTVSGQTGSGKTYFVSQLISNQEVVHDKKFDKIIFAFTMIQPIYLELKMKNQNVTLVEGFPGDAVDSICKSDRAENVLIILDDMMIETESDKRLPAMFTKMRHKNVSTIFLVQNFYFKGKYMKDITRNSHYTVLFENPRDASMISTLGRQMYPENSKFLPDAFRQATEKPYGYLFLDMKPGTDKKCRVREGILPQEQTFVYLPQ